MWNWLIFCVLLHAFTFTSCIVIYVICVWLWDLCDMCALYLIMLICLASVFYSDSNELYISYSCLINILWVLCVGLGHISMPTPLVLIIKCLYEPSMLKTSPIYFTHTRGSVVINHQKGRDWKHLGPYWVSVINDNTWLLWLTCVLQRQLS